jgi:CubicO group peptidase (beta-lactamase class C family)
MRQLTAFATASAIPRLLRQSLRPLGQTVAAVLLTGTVATQSLAAPREASADDEALVATLAQQFASGQVGGSILFWNDRERRVGFRNLQRIYPTRALPASPSPYPLGERLQDLGDLTYTVDGERFTVADFLAHESSIGVIVVQAGDVVLEHYAPGNDATSPWVSFSVTKSVTSMLIGAAVQDGFIESVEEPAVHYLPRLRGTSYESASIEDVLHMASGVAWNEDYADPRSDVALAGGLNGLDLQRYLGGLPREHEPGTVFNYNTGETNLVGEILRSAIGNNASTYLNAKIWQPFGMQHDASWVISGPGAGELGGCCISATLRDYARIGLFALHDGVLPDGTRVLPEDWIERSTRPSQGSEGYGYLWWLYDGNYAARGIFGQHIRIDPVRDLDIAVHSNAPAAVGTSYHEHIDAAVDAIRAAFAPTAVATNYQEHLDAAVRAAL